MNKKSYKFRLYPNKEQAYQLENWFGQARFVYNKFLSYRKDLYKAYKSTINIADIDMNLDTLKNLSTYENMANFLKSSLKEEYRWLKESNSQVLQQKLKDLDRAFQKMKNENAGYPKFKSKKYSTNSIRFPQVSQCKISEGKLKVPKMKSTLKFGNKNQYKRVFGTIKNLTILKENDGKYYVTFSAEVSDKDILKSFNINKKQKMKKSKKEIGIDLGIKSQIITSTGEVFDTKQATKDNEKKLKKLNKQHARKQKGSKNKEKSRLRLAKLYKHIANLRQDYIQKMTTKIIRENQTIVMEDLNVKGMIKNKKLSKALANASFGEIRRQLEYKAKWYGRELIFVDRFFASSKLCSTKNCQYIKKDLTLSDRKWICPSCGTKHDRDINAANNILYEGLNRVGTTRI